MKYTEDHFLYNFFIKFLKDLEPQEVNKNLCIQYKFWIQDSFTTINTYILFHVEHF